MTRGLTIDIDTEYCDPDVVLEILVGKRRGLALHPGHVDGLARLLGHAVGTIGARSTPEGGQCFHCEGTGRARPLWEPSLSAGHDVA